MENKNVEVKKLLEVFSPEVLAVKLGVSISTTFKWKTGRTPSRLAKEKITKLYNRVIKNETKACKNKSDK